MSKEETSRPEKVICAMSGGVDSSVTAKILKDAGYQVIGVTMKLFDNDDLGAPLDESAPFESTCCSLKDVQDAQQVALDLGIEHFTFNFSTAFGTWVIDRFCQSYLQGQTPNPCIDCNRFIKFNALQKRREELGYDYVATGHYARRCFDSESGRYLLKTGLDANKDQSYVLYSLTQDELAHTLFPLGDLGKPQVREIAHAAGFINAQKAESQDICFVPDGNYLRFIKQHTGASPDPGQIVHVDGTVLGTHTGLASYTIGQRKGIGIAWSEPLYVCGKDVAHNRLIVGTKDETLVSRVFVDDVNLISVSSITQPLAVTAKTFYRQKPQQATVVQTGSASVELTFAQPIRACAAGQAAVFYQEDVVVGGGTITGCE